MAVSLRRQVQLGGRLAQKSYEVVCCEGYSWGLVCCGISFAMFDGGLRAGRWHCVQVLCLVPEQRATLVCWRCLCGLLWGKASLLGAPWVWEQRNYAELRDSKA